MPIALLSKESDWPFLKKKVNIALNKALIISLLLLLVQSKMQAQLCAGPLTVKMVGASSSMPITIDQETSSVYCTESNEGAINITVYGGTPTYDYQWAHDSLNQNFLIDLPVGSYYVTVTDGNGCSEERTISIVNVDPLADSLQLVEQTACGTCYMNDGTQSFFYFEDEYIGAIIDLTTELDLGESTMCVDIADGPCVCQGDVGMRRKWCIKTDSIEGANIRLFFTDKELREMAHEVGYANEIQLINSGECYLQIYDYDRSDCVEDFPIQYLDQSKFSITKFDEEQGIWSLEVRDLDDVCVLLMVRGFSLPVDFLTFDGVTLEKINRLYWTTANETNNKGFEVEKSKNGLEFQNIGFVTYDASNEGSYSFDDLNPWTGSNFYRLKQVDLDDNFSYSHIIHLVRQSDFNFEVIQNPFRETLSLEISSNIAIDANISIFAIDGRVVRQEAIHNKTSREFLTKKVVKI